MLTRKLFIWDVTLAEASGQTRQQKFTAFWSPEKVSLESVAQACAAMYTAASKGKQRFLGVAATLVEDQPEPIAA